MRLFTAIDLPVVMLETIGVFLARLRPLAKLRWTPVGNLHITTKFIGEWPEGRLPEMIAALLVVQDGILRAAGSLRHKDQPVGIAVHGVGWFPDERRPRVFWAGVDGGQALAVLAHATEQAVAKLGVPVEARVYSPHLTLARVKDEVPVEQINAAAGDPDFGAFQASSFFLYLSENGKYSKLAEFSLNS